MIYTWSRSDIHNQAVNIATTVRTVAYVFIAACGQFSGSCSSDVFKHFIALQLFKRTTNAKDMHRLQDNTKTRIPRGAWNCVQDFCDQPQDASSDP